MRTKESYADGDIIDIGQTVNGCSEFIVRKDEHGNITAEYNTDDRRPYEYDVLSLLDIQRDNELYDIDDDIKIIGNIYDIVDTETKVLQNLVEAWEGLDEGNYTVSTINAWLLNKMKPAIDRARKILKT